MNVTLTWNGSDITESVISYERIQTICDGIGTIDIECAAQTMPNVVPWDLIRLWEGGNKKGEYNVLIASQSADTGMFRITAQDDSALLVNYFISDSYPDINDGSYARTWIEKFLTEAHVRYTITTSDMGNQVNNHSSFGMMTAYDQIMMLLAMNGWYMYFDQNGRAIVGDINAQTHHYKKYVDDDLIAIQTSKHDKTLRNRAVVWGKNGLWAEEKVITPWNYDKRDYRTVVVSNGYITNPGTLAHKIIDQFAHINFEPTLTFEGERNLRLGEFIKINSEFWSGDGMTTTVGSKMDATNGLTTNVTLDQKCPRLFTGFGYTSYVYVGTNGEGIWRKELGTDTWESFSVGLNDYDVQDLMIKNNTFAAVVGHKAYINLGSEFADWKQVTGILLDSGKGDLDIGHSYADTMFDVMACDIQEGTNICVFEYQLKESMKNPLYGLTENMSFQVYINPVTLKSVATKVLWIPNEFAVYDPFGGTGTNAMIWDDFKGVGVENFGPQELATAVAPFYYGLSNMEGIFGSSQVAIDTNPDPYGYTFGPLPETASPMAYWMGHFYGDVSIIGSEVISLWYYHGILGNMFCVGDQRNFFPPSPDYVAPPGPPAPTTRPVLMFTPNKDFPTMWPKYNILNRHIYHDTIAIESKTGEWNTPDYDVVDFVYSDPNHGGDGEYYYASYTLGKVYDVKNAHYNPAFNWAHCISTGNVTRHGLGTIDGVTLNPVNTIILVTGQNNPLENGLYMAMGADADWVRINDSSVDKGAIFYIGYGTDNADTWWQLVATTDPVLGTDNLEVKQILKWTDNGMTCITDLTNESHGLPSNANIQSMTNWASVASNGTMMWVYKTAWYDTTISYPPITLGSYGPEIKITWWFTSFGKNGFVKEKLWEHSTRTMFFGAGAYQPEYSISGETSPTLVGSPESPGMGMLFTINQWEHPIGEYSATANHYLVKAVNMGGKTRTEKVDIVTFNCDTVDKTCHDYSECNISLSEERGLKMTYTGNVITGDVVDPHFAIFMEARVQMQGSACPGDCLHNYGLHEQILGVTLIGSLLSAGARPYMEYRNSSAQDCAGWMGCNNKCGDAPLIESNETWPYGVPGATLDFSRIRQMTTRTTPQFLYDGREIRDGNSMGVMFPLAHPITQWSTRQIFPQADDFDGSYYISEGVNQCVYKELGGFTVATIHGFSTAPGFGMDEWTNTFVCNVFSLGRDMFWDATKHVYIMNPWDLFKDKNVCFLLKPNQIAGDGSYTITDFDFFEFDTEGSTVLAPLVSHTYGAPLVTYTLYGTERTGIWPQNFKKYNMKYKGAPVSGEWNDIKTYRLGGYTSVYDDKKPEVGMYAITAAGTGNMYNDPLIPGVTNTMLFSLSNVTDHYYFHPFLGQVGTVETSHFYYPAYYYVSISGADVGGIPYSGVVFWEDVPGGVWTDRSTGAPMIPITVTRLDDRM